MTEAEIMKALEWCELFTDNIVLSNKKGEKFTFALQSLQTIKQVLKDYNSKNAKIEKLNFENLQMLASIKGLKETARAEAIKELLTQADKKMIVVNSADGLETAYLEDDLLQIAKEMGVEL
jgi:hypothetical protein